jgi:hypothetical protein
MGVLTRGDYRRRLILLAAALGLAMATVIFVPIGTSRAVETVEEPAGVLLLRIDSDSGEGWVEYYPGANPASGLGTPLPDRQEFEITRKCDFNPTGGPSFLTFTPVDGSGVGAVSNGLGVKDKNNCSTAQGQIVSAGGEGLASSLGSYFSSVFRIVRGEVDVEGKGGTNLGVTYASGDSQEILLSNSADNGPDSGTGDNEIAVFEPPGGSRSVTFTATDGKVAIEGGGDGPVFGGTLRDSLGITEGTVFELASIREYDAGGLFCGDPAVGPSAPVQDGPALDIELERLANLKQQGCVAIEYTFRIEDDSVLFDANLDDQAAAHFSIRIEWDPMPDPFDPPHREINYFPDSPTSTYELVQACEGTDQQGMYIHPDEDPRFPPDGIVPWCLAGEQLLLLPGGQWQQIQWYDGVGPDPRFQ